MSQIKISSTGWLAILLRNGVTGVFNLHDISSWQYLKIEDDDKTNDIHRNLIKFSPNGQILIFNGQNKQLNVYIQTDFEKTNVWWILQRKIIVKNSITSIDLTNKYLYIADINGDIYRIDLLLNDKNQNLIISTEHCIMKNKLMLLDIMFIQMNEKRSFLITADQDDQIRLNNYPNTSHIEGYCRGHTEFISHIKLIDNNHILSASGDGTLRLWRLPDCVPLVLLHSKAFTLLSKEIFYTELYKSNDDFLLETYRSDAMSQEIFLSTSSIIDYSIWKMDVINHNSNIFIAFSIYAQRTHSIYLTSLFNMKKLANQQRKLTLDIGYGTIVDYCFQSKDSFINFNSDLDLYILFDSNILLKVDIISILICDKTELFIQSNEIIQQINNILTQKEFHAIDYSNNLITLDEIIFKQSFKNQINSSSSSSSSTKRKVERIEDESRKKSASLDNEENLTLDEYL